MTLCRAQTTLPVKENGLAWDLLKSNLCTTDTVWDNSSTEPPLSMNVAKNATSCSERSNVSFDYIPTKMARSFPLLYYGHRTSLREGHIQCAKRISITIFEPAKGSILFHALFHPINAWCMYLFNVFKGLDGRVGPATFTTKCASQPLHLIRHVTFPSSSKKSILVRYSTEPTLTQKKNQAHWWWISRISRIVGFPFQNQPLRTEIRCLGSNNVMRWVVRGSWK